MSGGHSQRGGSGAQPPTERTRFRGAIAVLLCGAAIGAVVRSANASIVGRIGGVSAALVLVVTGLAAWRGQRWASGVAFLVALCWAWASLALVIQGAIAGAEAAIWLVWSAVVIWTSITGRERDTSQPRFPPMRTTVGEDEAMSDEGQRDA